MALIKCQECGKEISDSAKICPNCGYRNNSRNGKRNFIIGIIIAFIIIIIGVIIGILIKMNNIQNNVEKDGGLSDNAVNDNIESPNLNTIEAQAIDAYEQGDFKSFLSFYKEIENPSDELKEYREIALKLTSLQGVWILSGSRRVGPVTDYTIEDANFAAFSIAGRNATFYHCTDYKNTYEEKAEGVLDVTGSDAIVFSANNISYSLKYESGYLLANVINDYTLQSLEKQNMLSSGDTGFVFQTYNVSEWCFKRSDKSSLTVNNTQNTGSNNEKCIVDGCAEKGTHEVTGLNGTTEYYCDDHYKEMQDILNGMLGTETSSSYSESVTGDDRTLYWTIAKDEVKSRLKSPRTAKFPFSSISDGVDITKAGDIVTVKSYVDAQNSFGAEIRSNFTVKIKLNGTKYSIESCIID